MISLTSGWEVMGIKACLAGNYLLSPGEGFLLRAVINAVSKPRTGGVEMVLSAEHLLETCSSGSLALRIGRRTLVWLRGRGGVSSAGEKVHACESPHTRSRS